MKLLVVTQKVDKNDNNLGFFHRWLEELAQNVEQLTVICLFEGEHSIPSNTRVFSLGKESGGHRLLYLFQFWKIIWRERASYGLVFVHMNPIYVVAAGLFWRLIKKKISLWYTHGSVTLQLRVAEKLVNIIFTASSESCRLKSKKIFVTGHGIDVKLFSPKPSMDRWEQYAIVTVGRIDPSKNIGSILEVAKELKVRKFPFHMNIVGSPSPGGEEYLQLLKKTIEEDGLDGWVNFTGGQSMEEVAAMYSKSDLFLSLSSTGSLDKAPLEASAAGLVVLTSNEAFAGEFPDRNIVENDPGLIAEKIIILSKKSSGESLRNYVVANHSLPRLAEKITSSLSK